MTSTIVRHRVADFDAWRKVYDGFAPIQADHGVNAPPGAMPELKEAMSHAGVNASVEISDFDEVETGALVGA